MTGRAASSFGRDELFVGGQWRKPDSPDRIPVISPSTERVIGQVPDAGPADVDAAVRAARGAFTDGAWPGASTAERAAVLQQALALLARSADEIAHLVTAEMGLPLSLSTKQVPGSVGLGRYFIDLATREPPGGAKAGADGHRGGVPGAGRRRRRNRAVPQPDAQGRPRARHGVQRRVQAGPGDTARRDGVCRRHI